MKNEWKKKSKEKEGEAFCSAFINSLPLQTKNKEKLIEKCVVDWQNFTLESQNLLLSACEGVSSKDHEKCVGFKILNPDVMFHLPEDDSLLIDVAECESESLNASNKSLEQEFRNWCYSGIPSFKERGEIFTSGFSELFYAPQEITSAKIKLLDKKILNFLNELDGNWVLFREIPRHKEIGPLILSFWGRRGYAQPLFNSLRRIRKIEIRRIIDKDTNRKEIILRSKIGSPPSAKPIAELMWKEFDTKSPISEWQVLLVGDSPDKFEVMYVGLPGWNLIPNLSESKTQWFIRTTSGGLVPYRETLNLECKRCGFCCWKEPCGLLPEDLPKILQYLNIPLNEAVEEFFTWKDLKEVGERPSYGMDYYLVPKRHDEMTIFPHVRHEGTINLRTLRDYQEKFGIAFPPCVFLDMETLLCTIHSVKPYGGRVAFCGRPLGDLYSSSSYQFSWGEKGVDLWKNHPIYPKNTPFWSFFFQLFMLVKKYSFTNCKFFGIGKRIKTKKKIFKNKRDEEIRKSMRKFIKDIVRESGNSTEWAQKLSKYVFKYNSFLVNLSREFDDEYLAKKIEEVRRENPKLWEVASTKVSAFVKEVTVRWIGDIGNLLFKLPSAQAGVFTTPNLIEGEKKSEDVKDETLMRHQIGIAKERIRKFLENGEYRTNKIIASLIGLEIPDNYMRVLVPFLKKKWSKETGIKLPFVKIITPSEKLVDKIASLLDEKDAAGERKYADLEIAELLGISRDYVTFIRNSLGFPPVRKPPIEELTKIGKVKSLLREGYSVSEVASIVGWANKNDISRVKKELIEAGELPDVGWVKVPIEDVEDAEIVLEPKLKEAPPIPPKFSSKTSYIIFLLKEGKHSIDEVAFLSHTNKHNIKQYIRGIRQGRFKGISIDDVHPKFRAPLFVAPDIGEITYY